MGDASAMRNLASPDKLRQWARAGTVAEGAIKVVPVMWLHCVLVLSTTSDVGERDLTTVVSEST